MICSENGNVTIKGSLIDVIADATCLLNGLYQTLSDKYGKEMANKTLVNIGRRAVMDDEEANEDLKNTIFDLVMSDLVMR